MLRIDQILMALETRGADIDLGQRALVWIDRPGLGCFVRAADVLRIEPSPYRPRAGSMVTVRLPDGSTEVLLDSRRAKDVRSAVQRAEEMSLTSALDEISKRFQCATAC